MFGYSEQVLAIGKIVLPKAFTVFLSGYLVQVSIVLGVGSSIKKTSPSLWKSAQSCYLIRILNSPRNDENWHMRGHSQLFMVIDDKTNWTLWPCLIVERQ